MPWEGREGTCLGWCCHSRVGTVLRGAEDAPGCAPAAPKAVGLGTMHACDQLYLVLGEFQLFLENPDCLGQAEAALEVGGFTGARWGPPPRHDWHKAG